MMEEKIRLWAVISAVIGTICCLTEHSLIRAVVLSVIIVVASLVMAIALDKYINAKIERLKK